MLTHHGFDEPIPTWLHPSFFRHARLPVPECARPAMHALIDKLLVDELVLVDVFAGFGGHVAQRRTARTYDVDVSREAVRQALVNEMHKDWSKQGGGVCVAAVVRTAILSPNSACALSSSQARICGNANIFSQAEVCLAESPAESDLPTKRKLPVSRKITCANRPRFFRETSSFGARCPPGPRYLYLPT